MKRKQLVNLDSHILDRIAGGCQVVATNPGKAYGMQQKLQGLMDIAVMPASYADIREVMPASYADIREATPAAVDGVLPIISTVATQVDSVDVGTALELNEAPTMDDMLDVQGAGSTDILQDLPDLPVDWCGTGSTGLWEDCDGDDSAQPTANADDEVEAKDDVLAEPIMGNIVEQVYAPPTVRDHRAASMAAASAAANAPEAIIRDHRPAVDAASDASQPIVRDQR